MSDEVSKDDGIFSKRSVVRYAYHHKKDETRFGLLEAIDYHDAKQWLGSTYRIVTTTVSINEDHKQMFDKDYRLKLVKRAFKEKFERLTRGGGES